MEHGIIPPFMGVWENKKNRQMALHGFHLSTDLINGANT
jgi:hypothetical protein